MIDPIVVEARRTLLDSLEALHEHLDAIVLVGAQAIYLHTGAARTAVAEYTTDADLAIDTRALDDEPLVEAVMHDGGFTHSEERNPGVWISGNDVQVDLMVPAAIAGKGRRSVDAPPHSRSAMRKSRGLEAALVDNGVMELTALDPVDARVIAVRVAGPSALLIAKLHKIGERLAAGRPAENKDAHDVYRLLAAVEVPTFGDGVRRLLADPLCHDVADEGLRYLDELFARDPSADGSRMAGAAEEGIGDPAQVSLAVSLLAGDVLATLDIEPRIL